MFNHLSLLWELLVFSNLEKLHDKGVVYLHDLDNRDTENSNYKTDDNEDDDLYL